MAGWNRTNASAFTERNSTIKLQPPTRSNNVTSIVIEPCFVLTDSSGWQAQLDSHQHTVSRRTVFCLNYIPIVLFGKGRWNRTNILGVKVQCFTTKLYPYCLARSEEFESPAYKFVACCSIQLSYDRIILGKCFRLYGFLNTNRTSRSW